MKTDDITNLKPTYQTSYFKLFLAAVVVGPLLVIGLVALANAVLPATDADAFKKPLFALWASLTGASGLATLVGGVSKTIQKATAQKELAVAAQAVAAQTATIQTANIAPAASIPAPVEQPAPRPKSLLEEIHNPGGDQ